jgi:hypothetical protein
VIWLAIEDIDSRLAGLGNRGSANNVGRPAM